MDHIAKSQDGGVSNSAISTFTGDGTALAVNCGFEPRYIKLVNLTDRITYEHYFGMAQGETIKTVAAGTQTLDTEDAAITRHGTVSGGSYRGFSVPADVNIAGKLFAIHAVG